MHRHFGMQSSESSAEDTDFVNSQEENLFYAVS